MAVRVEDNPSSAGDEKPRGQCCTVNKNARATSFIVKLQ
jgi:hypothetical protein